MKDFKNILQLVEFYEDRENPNMDRGEKDPRSPEERDIDDRISKLTDVDSMMRKQNHPEAVRSQPLEYDMGTLIALKGYYMGTMHGKKFPIHAERLPRYEQVLKRNVPHLFSTVFADANEHNLPDFKPGR